MGFMMVFLIGTGAVGAEFPGRNNPKYQGTSYIEIENLYQDYLKDALIVVDVRSKLEYDTIHINGARHVPIGKALFEKKLKDIAGEKSGRKIVFYCNGTTCYKSYEAQLRATNAGVENTYAFDLGIPVWAELYPEKTVLLGKMMTESKIGWIPKSEFKKKCLSWEKFKEVSVRAGTKVIDTRDNVQKGILTPQLLAQLPPEKKRDLEIFTQKNDEMLAALNTKNNVIAQPLDKMIKNIIKRGMFMDRTLLIYDQVGKQVRWLMYQLEDAGYSDYYFLNKGAQYVIGTQSYSLN